MAPTVLRHLKSIACVEEGSREKENVEDKDGEEIFGLFRINAAKHVW